MLNLMHLQIKNFSLARFQDRKDSLAGCVQNIFTNDRLQTSIKIFV